ncbi:MAG: hypothetical protein HC841_08415, partial [Verrucomicrobiae bacterium]|nr:hypothetical protein [Verrucomicrobiae bacterium]
NSSTIYRHSVAIAALSRGSYPIFPHFEHNEDGDEWPADRRSILLRDWLREHGFRRVAALKAHLGAVLALRASIYQDEANRIRLQILFLPQRNGQVVPSFVLSSLRADETRFVTDNFFLPFGGFYPDHWYLLRRPLVRSLPHLLAIHERRLRQGAAEWQSWDSDPLAELNHQQRVLEQINTELGFLFPRHLQDEHGMLTWAGRFRVWQELWMLNYFGRPRAY